MRLGELFERLDVTYLRGGAGAAGREIAAVVYDSRKVVPGCLFVCIAGASFDGHAFIGEAFARGAAAVLVEEGRLPGDAAGGTGAGQADCLPEDAVVASCADTRLGLARVSAAYFGYPAEQIPVIGITGTKGKTTSTYMIRSILENAGYRVGLIGTIEAIVGGRHLPAANTTPESYVVQQYLREMIDAGMDCAVMEVSSQALMMHRTAGIEFEIGVFTNLSQDHVGPGEHGSFEEYLACKSLLFRQCRLGIVNADDPYAEQILKGHTCEVERFGITAGDADYRAEHIEHVSRPGYLGIRFDVTGRKHFPVELDVPGSFSVYNALTAVAVCAHFHIEDSDVQRALREAKVRGRIEPVKVSDEFTLMIDYAHNAMALKSLLTTLRDYEPKRIVCVFGCGGNRAKSRRYEMGEAAGRLADFTIITSDNPRFEEPQAIIDDIVTGIERTDGAYTTIIDRREAIAYAIRHGEPGDVIVLAGKGHEDYQEIRGVKHPMDERVLIADILREDAAAGERGRGGGDEGIPAAAVPSAGRGAAASVT